MRAFIHAFEGRPWNKECQLACDGFRKLGIETVLFTTNEEFDARNSEDVVVGATVFIWHALNQRGIPVRYYDYPQELKSFLGREIWKTRLKDIQKQEFPVFIKPVEEKLAPAVIVKSMADLRDYKLLDSETELYCSEIVSFVSEWRCFLLYGQIIGIKPYLGNSDIRCDQIVINAAVKAYQDMPAGCSLDFGVTEDGRTIFIEMNDGYSLGAYGLESTLYAKLLTARWAELNGTEDVFYGGDDNNDNSIPR